MLGIVAQQVPEGRGQALDGPQKGIAVPGAPGIVGVEVVEALSELPRELRLGQTALEGGGGRVVQLVEVFEQQVARTEPAEDLPVEHLDHVGVVDIAAERGDYIDAVRVVGVEVQGACAHGHPADSPESQPARARLGGNVSGIPYADLHLCLGRLCVGRPLLRVVIRPCGAA
jgi:hypothetical protein